MSEYEDREQHYRHEEQEQILFWRDYFKIDELESQIARLKAENEELKECNGTQKIIIEKEMATSHELRAKVVELEKADSDWTTWGIKQKEQIENLTQRLREAEDMKTFYVAELEHRKDQLQQSEASAAELKRRLEKYEPV